MSSSQRDDRAPDPVLLEGVYERLLDDLRDVSDKALNRLRELGDHLPGGTIEQVERLHDDPSHDRRKAVRLPDDAVPVWVQAVDLPEGEGVTGVKDHCPSGLAVRLPCPAGVGTILHVQLPPELGGGGWVAVEVKHCRRDGDGWVAGCEVLANQPPL